MSSFDIGPQYRESELAILLSPITKYSSGPSDTDTSNEMLFNRYDSSNSSPSGYSSENMVTLLFSILMVSPGSPIILLTRNLPELSGFLNTIMSPRLGSLNLYVNSSIIR